MWNVIEKASEQVALYSTVSGQAWYLCVFVFRLIVVATIGSSVYGDEQSAFRCSTKVIGCDNVCYDKFSKISHLRFWAFQILALTAPVIIFHFYTIYVQGEIEKLKIAEQKALDEQESEYYKDIGEVPAPKPILKLGTGQSNWDTVRQNVLENSIRRRRKSVGRFKQRKVFAKTKMEEITMTRGITVAHFCSVIARIVIEIVFLFLAYDLFRFAEYPDEHNDGRIVSDGRRVSSPFDLFWIRVPQLYRCGGDSVRWACSQHMLPGNSDAYVPCWVSRPWEKTIFLRYMNTLSVICLILSIIEIFHICIREVFKYSNKKQKPSNRDFQYTRAPSAEFQTAPQVAITAAPETEVFYNTSEGQKDPAVKESIYQTLLDPKPSNPFLDLATGNLNIEALRKALRQERRKDQKEDRTNKGKTGPTKERKRARDTVDQQPGKTRPSRARFEVPYSTQSLNRPRKVARPRYSSLFKLGSISFSQSEGEGASGSEGSESATETERESVSHHSEEYV